MPTEDEFKNFIETVTDSDLSDDIAENAVPNLNIQVLDDSTDEVVLQVRKMKADKAFPDGIAPGVVKFFPANWYYSILGSFLPVIQRVGPQLSSL